MKKLLLLFAIILSIQSFGQNTYKVIDSFYIAGKTAIVDTLTCRVNHTTMYELSLSGYTASGKKTVAVRNVNGIYSILKESNSPAFGGLTGAKFEVILLNKIIVVRVTTPSPTIIWDYKKR